MRSTQLAFTNAQQRASLKEPWEILSRRAAGCRGTGIISKPDLSEQREVVSAFLMAWRGGDFEGLLTLLDPDLVVHFDEAGA